MGKNIEKIQSIVDGKYQRKIQVGYQPKSIREEGETWTDDHGSEWIWKNGSRKRINVRPGVGFDRCSDCERLILKQRDQDTYNRFGRCFYFQINFEANLKIEGKWSDWVADQEKKRFESIEREVQSILKNMKEDADQAFDRSVVNAMGNENVSMQVKKMKE